MKAERRMIPEWGVTLDGVWIPYSVLTAVNEQEELAGGISPQQEKVLLRHNLASPAKVPGWLNPGPALQEFIDAIEFPTLAQMTTGIYVARPGVPVTVQARQWDNQTDPEELAAWCDGWTYTGTQHGHTTPHFAMHTCINAEVRDGSPKGHADPGDWIVRHEDGTYEIVPPGEFTGRFDPQPAEG